MSKKRRQYIREFKAKVALAALKRDWTTSQLAARFDDHPSMVSQRKQELLNNASGLFKDKSEEATQKIQDMYISDQHDGIIMLSHREAMVSVGICQLIQLL